MDADQQMSYIKLRLDFILLIPSKSSIKTGTNLIESL